MRVLVTGAAGFLGRALCQRLRETGATVLPVDNAVIPTGVHDGVEHCNCVDYGTAWRFARRQPTHIVHAAGIASPYWYSRYPLETIDVAVGGLRNVLDIASVTGARVLYLSSSEVYGDPDVIPTPESYLGRVDTLGKRSPYDESKRLGETLCSVYAERFGTEAVIARPFNVYGPGMGSDDRRMMPALRKAFQTGEPVTVYGTGKHTRTFCYIDDAVSGLLLMLDRGEAGQAYNVGNDGPEVSMRELAELAGVRVHLRPYPADYPSEEPTRRCPDITKLRALGYEPRVSLTDGLRRFLE